MPTSFRTISLRVLSVLSVLLAACGSTSDQGENETPAAYADPDTLASEQGAEDDGASNPPANWSKLTTTSAPATLYLYASKSSNAGTVSSFRLTYQNGSGTYTCDISDISNGKEKSCTPTQSSSTTGSGNDDFFVEFLPRSDGSYSCDGLKVGSLSATINNVKYTNDVFNMRESSPDCEGCNVLNKNCGTCWLDAYASGWNGSQCVKFKSPMNSELYTECMTDSGYSRSTDCSW